MDYPNEIFTLQTKTKTFGIDAFFKRREENEGSPMKVFSDDRLTRFVFTILENKTAVSCNIPFNRLESLMYATKYAYEKHMDNLYVPKNQNNSSPAFTERFFAGNLKGKTPADILIENPEKGKDMLNTQYKWLKANLDKYPQNQRLIDALLDATKLTEEDLKGAASSGNSVIELLNVGVRPQIRKRKENGYCPCREATVVWKVGSDYPVNIKIKNYEAPVIIKEDKTVNVKITEKNKDSEVIGEFNIGPEDWISAVSQMKLTKESYYMISFPKALKAAEAGSNEWRTAQE